MTDYSFVPPSSTTPKVDPAELPKWLIEEDDDYMAVSYTHLTLPTTERV